MDLKSPETPSPAQPFGWHALDAASVLDKLGSNGHRGLSAIQVRRRLRRYGANLPAVLHSEQAFAWHNLNAPLLILPVAVGLGLILSHDWAGGVILLILPLLNLLIHLLLAQRSKKQRRQMCRRLLTDSLVLRDGEPNTIDPAQLVPGDLLVANAGTRVWADARLIEAENLRADESSLGGRSSVEKSTAPIAMEIDWPEQSSMIWCGAVITVGRGRAVVVATGPGTRWSRALPSQTQAEARPGWLLGAMLALLVAWCLRGWVPAPFPVLLAALMALLMLIDRWISNRFQGRRFTALENCVRP